MKDVNDILEDLNFHDSYISSVCFTDEGVLRVHIHYYNWEGNNHDSQAWKTKKLCIEIEHCIHFRFSSPGLWNEDQEIHKHELLLKHNAIVEQIDSYKTRRSNCEFENTIAVKFLTHSYGEPLFGESIGYLEIGGLNAKLLWSDAELSSKPIHIPVGK